mmetsp:Transcript_19370/g.74386  ORF Transcript_19370/g.74386 Transcript_19370/m.74386 type:complete len:542 (-) Transcript_19370:61-1686(-)
MRRMKIAWVLAVAVVVSAVFSGAAEAQSDSYIGSVVEMVPVNFNAGQYASALAEMKAFVREQRVADEETTHVLAVKLLNLRRYEHAVMVASNETEIIVFNEDGITGWPQGYNEGRDGALPWLEEVPDVGTTVGEELQWSSPSVYYGSLFAKTYGLTVVIDIGEVEWCDSERASACPSDGRWQYNTQLAFGTDGTLLAKHRKLHLFLADAEIFNYPAPSLDYFVGPHGVTFGMLVCFDVWFRFPGFPMADSSPPIENFVLSSWWENNGTLPLVSAVNMQQAFARSAQVNLLACSVGVSFFNSGSGVYNGPANEQNFVYNVDFPSLDMHIVTMELPLSPRSGSLTNSLRRSIAVTQEEMALSLGTSASQVVHATPSLSSRHGSFISMPENATVSEVVIGPGDSVSDVQLVSGGLTCSFSYSVSNDGSVAGDTFALLAYEGPYFDYMLYGQLCSLYKCNADLGCDVLTLDAGDVSFDSIDVLASFNSRQPALAIASGPDGQLLDMADITVSEVADGALLSTAPSFSSPIVGVVLYAEEAGKVSP